VGLNGVRDSVAVADSLSAICAAAMLRTISTFQEGARFGFLLMTLVPDATLQYKLGYYRIGLTQFSPK
jgi:hypothetical protein